MVYHVVDKQAFLSELSRSLLSSAPWDPNLAFTIRSMETIFGCELTAALRKRVENLNVRWMDANQITLNQDEMGLVVYKLAEDLQYGLCFRQSVFQFKSSPSLDLSSGNVLIFGGALQISSVDRPRLCSFSETPVYQGPSGLGAAKKNLSTMKRLTQEMSPSTDVCPSPCKKMKLPDLDDILFECGIVESPPSSVINYCVEMLPPEEIKLENAEEVLESVCRDFEKIYQTKRGRLVKTDQTPAILSKSEKRILTDLLETDIRLEDKNECIKILEDNVRIINHFVLFSKRIQDFLARNIKMVTERV